MDTKIQRVTPEIATKWLEGNTHNRALRQTVVERYARDMKANRWKLTHQGLAFNGDGTLIDGQHRLWAIIESGKTVEFMVTRGLDESTQEAIDGGEKRMERDVLALRGEKVAPVMIGIARTLAMQLKRTRILTRTEVVHTFDKYSEAIYFVSAALKPTRGVRLANVMVPIVRAHIIGTSQPELVRFCQVLSDGIMTDAIDQPIIMLRNWLMERKPARDEIYGKTARALSAFLDREKIKTLYAATKELFPLPEETKREK